MALPTISLILFETWVGMKSKTKTEEVGFGLQTVNIVSDILHLEFLNSNNRKITCV